MSTQQIDTGTKSGSEARKVLDRVTAAVTGRDNATLATLYAPNAEAIGPDGEVSGVNAVLEFFEQFQQALPDLEWESLHSFETGDTAIDEGWVCGTNTGPLTLPNGEQIPPTGRTVRVREVDIVTVADGKVVSHRFYYDQMELLGQLGLLPDESAQ